MSNTPQPSNEILQYAVKLALSDDKPILFDYWVDSFDKKCFIGFKENNEKILVKNKEEYTSPIVKIPKIENCKNEFLIITENSIYIVSSQIEKRKIKSMV
jgi:hypothetical protein